MDIKNYCNIYQKAQNALEDNWLRSPEKGININIPEWLNTFRPISNYGTDNPQPSIDVYDYGLCI